jgi:ppGpp synthetase/RelA/SpoT-type nucleotidyltranferase
MARTSSEARRAFVDQYKKGLSELHRKAYIAELAVREAIAITPLDIHAVLSRPKDPESLRLKLIEKEYSDPASQVTDKIGVRVITYYSSDVDKVVETLKRRFDVDSRRSIDKREQLGLRDFGYRSVHLIALDGADAADAAQAEDHAVQVAHVFGFDDKLDDGFAVLVLADIDAADVGVVVGDDGGQLLQHAGAVVAGDGDLDG